METATQQPSTLQQQAALTVALFHLLEGTTFEKSVLVCPSYDASKYGMEFTRSRWANDEYPDRYRVMYLTKIQGQIYATMNCRGGKPLEWFEYSELVRLNEYLLGQAGLV